MPRETVVDVGDGACTVLRCPCMGPCDVAIVDCGVYRGSAQDATNRLRSVLGPDELGRLQTLVVTHFDADHWEGLRLLAEQVPPGILPGRVDIVYPRTPERGLDPGVLELALLATHTGTGVRALDLVNVWAKVTNVRRRPVCEGDQFVAGGREWQALWPPRHLTTELRVRLRRAVDGMDELAEDLAKAGHPSLKNNLEAAREVGFSGRNEGDHPPDWDRVEQSDREPWHDAPEPDEPLVGGDAGPEDDAAGVHGHFPDLGLIPEEFHGRFRAAGKLVAAANNDLSLVFHDDEGRRLIVFGDIQGNALKSVVAKAGPSYSIVLPPHHGTVRVPRKFPEASACLAQAGTHHLDHWDKHLRSHDQWRPCLTTARVGTMSFM
jgi:hypothetical protein